jgi:hypothetical protein
MIKVEFSRLGSIVVLKEPVTLELTRSMLYGRNGSGKTLIMKATIVELTPENAEFLVPGLHGLKRLLKNTDFKATVNEKMNEKMQRIARVTASTARIITEVDDKARRYKINIGDQADLQLMLSDPNFAEKLNDFFKYYLDIEIYGGFYRELYGGRGEWIKLVNMPYSYRRIIAMLYALEKCDTIFIEAFDSGLHIITQKYLISHISDQYKDKVVVAETHHASAIHFALQKDWKVYYVEKDKVTKLDLSKVDVFLKEFGEVMFP